MLMARHDHDDDDDIIFEEWILSLENPVFADAYNDHCLKMFKHG